MKTLPNHTMNKRDYLVGKLVDGATALNEFFEQVQEDSSLNPADVARDLASKHDLTDQQQKKMGIIASRVTKAKEVVDYLKEKFGVDEDGYIADQNGFQQYMRNEFQPGSDCVPNHDFNAYLQIFTIMFDFIHDEPVGGPLGSTPTGHLDDSLDEDTLRRAENEKKYIARTARLLSYKIYSERIANPYKSDERSEKAYLLGILHWIDTNDIVNKHEIKHIIDKLIGSSIAARELSANLASYDRGEDDMEAIIKMSLHQDIGNATARVQIDRSMLSEMEEELSDRDRSDPESIIASSYRMQKRFLAAQEWYLQIVQDLSPDLIFGILQNGLPSKVLSYIVGTTDAPKLQHRLELVNNYLVNASTEN